jgi:hypothetical protein
MMLGMHPWIGSSDEVRLGLLTEWVTAELVDEVLAERGVRDQRPGALPARFMVYYVLALALFQQDSYDDVAENLVGALEGMDEAIPNRSSFTRARQRLGAGVIEAVFRKLAGPVAPAGLEGAFWQGMRVTAVDGFLLDVPDTPANRAAFGGPAARGQPAGFPQARVVTLTETGTHSSVDARVGGYCAGEQELAVAMAGSAAGMLVIMDRAFVGVALWKAYMQAGAHLLIRARSSVARRPVQVLDDGTYLARMNPAGQKGAHPGGVMVRVIEYRVDGGEVMNSVAGSAATSRENGREVALRILALDHDVRVASSPFAHPGPIRRSVRPAPRPTRRPPGNRLPLPVRLLSSSRVAARAPGRSLSGPSCADAAPAPAAGTRQ